MDALIADLEFDTLLPAAPFRERHERTIKAPIEVVWQTLLDLPADDIRLLAPLFQLRGLPSKLLGRRAPAPLGDKPALELFVEEGFVLLRQDERPTEGHAVLIFGAAGVFWSPAHNGPRSFASPQEFLAFDEPGNAKTVARFEAREVDGVTTLVTETVVVGTDRSSTRKFGAYWAIIRGPSGLIRRSWLAAIDRQADSPAVSRSEHLGCGDERGRY